MRDNRVHVCLYFIQPSGHGLKPLDVLTLRNRFSMKLLSTRSRFTNSPILMTKNNGKRKRSWGIAFLSPLSDLIRSSKWMDGRSADDVILGVSLKVCSLDPYLVFKHFLNEGLFHPQLRTWSIAISSLYETCSSAPTWRIWKRWPTASITKISVSGNWPELAPRPQTAGNLTASRTST